jgi:glycosyltransferase involved in cell wall biosynthesis
MRFSVILNTHNRAHFLPRVLAAWTRIEPDRFTMIVADDGSEDSTDGLLRAAGPKLPFRLIHVRHPKQGHRRAEILNKAVHLAADEALLFTDADSLPARDLLDVHGRCFASDRLLVGGYLRLDPAFTESLTEQQAQAGDYERQLSPAFRRKLRWQHRKHVFYTWLRKRGRPHVMGLNMVIPRSGFLAINGYDNNFRGWGRADGDVRERLKQVGVRPFSDWDRALVFHLHHPPDSTKQQQQNVAYAERARIPTRAESGFAEVADEARRSVVFDNGK